MGLIFTIGYEGTDIDRFVATLKAVGVEKLADVRALALSRKKGFSKKSLSGRLEKDGIDYLHLPELGDPKPGREAARAGLYDRFRAIYGAHLNTESAQARLRELSSFAAENPTCLLCFERDPATCHRTIVAEALTNFGFKVCDLYGDKPERYVIHSSQMPSHYPCQGIAPA